MSHEASSSDIHDQIMALLSDEHVRPRAEDVGRLVVDGMTIQDIFTAGEAAGFKPPKMGDTLKDAATLIPYTQLAVDRILADDDESLVIAALRDGEMFGDDGDIRYPGRMISLPTSGSLLDSLEKGIASGDPMVEAFFAQHRMSKEEVAGRKIKLLDPGYQGSVALKLGSALQALYGIASPIETGALEAYMICMGEPAFPNVHQILHSEDIAPDAQTGVTLPRLTRMLGGEDTLTSVAQISPTYAIATAMQTMPRHTGHYAQLAERDGKVIAVSMGYTDPSYQPYVRSNVDEIDLTPNPNVYNPLASLVVQHMVVSAALYRDGKLTA